MANPNVIAKAIVSALVAGLGTLQVAAADGGISAIDVIQIVTATVAAFGFVWGIPNTVPQPPPVAAPLPPVVP